MSVIKSKKFDLCGRKFSVNVEFYNSAQDVANDCKIRKRTDDRFHNYDTERIKMDWHGCNSYDEALNYLRNGYQPTVEKFQEKLNVNKFGTEKRIKFENNVHGFAPVVPLALKGVPNNMINMTMKPIKCKVIDIYYDMTVSCGVETEQIIKNGQELISAITSLEKQGYRFNLYSMQTYCDYDNADMLCVKVKSSDKPLDLKRMSTPLTHPSFFRVIGFDWYGKCPVAKYRSSYGRGFAYEFRDSKDREEFAKKMFGDNAVYLSAGYLGDENSIKEVLKNDRKQNHKDK